MTAALDCRLAVAIALAFAPVHTALPMRAPAPPRLCRTSTASTCTPQLRATVPPVERTPAALSRT